MSLPTKDEKLKLNFVKNGFPFVSVNPKSTYSTYNLDYTKNGFPFVIPEDPTTTVNTSNFFLFF